MGVKPTPRYCQAIVGEGNQLSDYNPEFFGTPRLSEQLADAAKRQLDTLGRSDLKHQIDDALYGSKEPHQSVNLGRAIPSDRGWMI